MKLFIASVALLLVFTLGLALGHQIGTEPIRTLKASEMTDMDIAVFEAKVGLESDENWQGVEF
jgi:hypothetical protein